MLLKRLIKTCSEWNINSSSDFFSVFVFAHQLNLLFKFFQKDRYILNICIYSKLCSTQPFIQSAIICCCRGLFSKWYSILFSSVGNLKLNSSIILKALKYILPSTLRRPKQRPHLISANYFTFTTNFIKYMPQVMEKYVNLLRIMRHPSTHSFGLIC